MPLRAFKLLGQGVSDTALNTYGEFGGVIFLSFRFSCSVVDANNA